MFERWGVPERLYSDRHGIFFPVNSKPALEKELAGRRVSLSQFGKIMERLGVTHIKPNSPQAKRRVKGYGEPFNIGLWVDLRRKSITSMKEANASFRKQKIRSETQKQHVILQVSSHELDLLLVKEHGRKADKEPRISYEGVKYQLRDQ
ncbi:MAG TPA: hypothetical protein DEP01_02160 [Aminobacterium sp.]|uniref:hypothetical protein n=1 Tax=Aminobacterium TaxID=81466 RepID=UPI000EC26860|nr:hypothetical protein [Aminobacterium sp. UBA4834]HCA40413.1 hypothetical protein [Aminobacterium sp.]